MRHQHYFLMLHIDHFHGTNLGEIKDFRFREGRRGKPASALFVDHGWVQTFFDGGPDRETGSEIIAFDGDIGAITDADLIDLIDLSSLAQAAAREFRASAGEVERLARRILGSPACARFFGGSAARWSGNEVAVAEAGEVLRIDRLVALDEDGRRTWWVLDYKLHHRPEGLGEYRSQLLRYRRAVQSLEPSAEVRCAFITGEGSVIEVHPRGCRRALTEDRP
jgi:hypothetical protein